MVLSRFARKNALMKNGLLVAALASLLGPVSALHAADNAPFDLAGTRAAWST